MLTLPGVSFAKIRCKTLYSTLVAVAYICCSFHTFHPANRDSFSLLSQFRRIDESVTKMVAD